MPRYWCHTCCEETPVDPVENDEGELECPTCADIFIEEIEEDNVDDRPQDFKADLNDSKTDPSSPPPPPPQPQQQQQQQQGQQWSGSFGNNGNIHVQFSSNFNGLNNLFGGMNQNQNNQNQSNQNQQPNQPNPFNSFQAFNPFQMMNAIPGGAGSIFQQFMQGIGGNANGGDFFHGNMQQLINQLMINDPNSHGPPPAAKAELEKLLDQKVTSDMITSGTLSDCAVCKDEFEVEQLFKELPCKHMFHPECIMPWLEAHNTCPVCRYELPTDDLHYEQMRAIRDSQRKEQEEKKANERKSNHDRNDNDNAPPSS